jgi:hypothetical protein
MYNAKILNDTWHTCMVPIHKSGFFQDQVEGPGLFATTYEKK